jgi:hypothetical protein
MDYLNGATYISYEKKETNNIARKVMQTPKSNIMPLKENSLRGFYLKTVCNKSLIYVPRVAQVPLPTFCQQISKQLLFKELKIQGLLEKSFINEAKQKNLAKEDTNYLANKCNTYKQRK